MLLLLETITPSCIHTFLQQIKTTQSIKTINNHLGFNYKSKSGSPNQKQERKKKKSEYDIINKTIKIQNLRHEKRKKEESRTRT